MEDLAGRQLGQYRIVAPLGEGGMATVYRAYQPSMDRYVAIKVLPRHYATDPSFVARFEQEARVIAGLEHLNILPVHDYGEAEGYTYLVMRFVEGGTLTSLLQGQPLPLSQICHILSQVGAALDYAHSRGVVHRDVKPSNVLIDEQGNCLLSDFGIARMIQATTRFTSTGSFIGTPTYASPEQCLGRDLDGRSDLYSLGVMLYEMVTGRPPFDAETPMAIVVKHIHDPLPLPRAINPSLPEAVERVILKALAKDPDDRYQTAGEMVRALAAVAGEEAALPMRMVPATVTPPPELKPKPAMTTRPHPERGQRIPTRNWILGGLVALCLLLGLLGGGATLFTLAARATATAAAVPRVGPATIASAQTRAALVAPPLLATSAPTRVPPAGPTPVPARTGMPTGRTWQNWAKLGSFPSPGAKPSGVIRVADNLWVVIPRDRIYRLNMKGDIIAEAAFSQPCEKVAWDGESLWCTNMGNTIVKVDPASGKELASFEADMSNVRITWDGSTLWMIDMQGNLASYDRAGKRLRRLAIPVRGSPTGLAWVGGELWVADVFGELTRFDSEFKKIGSFSLTQCGAGSFPYDLALYWDGKSLWLADANENRILQCAPAD